MNPVWNSHRRLNGLQSALLILSMLGIAAMAGSLLLGEKGAWLAAGVALMALLIEPTTASALTLRLYRARPLHPAEAPELWALLRQLAERVGLPAVPVPHYVLSQMINAFATGSRQRAAIALTDGLLRALTPRELAGVLAGMTAARAGAALDAAGATWPVTGARVRCRPDGGTPDRRPAGAGLGAGAHRACFALVAALAAARLGQSGAFLAAHPSGDRSAHQTPARAERAGLGRSADAGELCA